MTVVTYQGLHAACNNWSVDEEEIDNEEEETEETNGNGKSTNPYLDNIVNGLKTQNIKTIVVDEARNRLLRIYSTVTNQF
jgi:beta-phosphoglucomutase-like phosphatase (HAD superfamily)